MSPETSRIAPLEITEPENTAPHPHVANFLSQVYEGSEEASDQLTIVSPLGALALSHKLVGLYERGYLATANNPRYRAIAMKRSRLLHRHLDGATIEDLQQEADSLPILPVHFAIVPEWLRKNEERNHPKLEVLLGKTDKDYFRWIERRAECRQYLFSSQIEEPPLGLSSPHAGLSFAQLLRLRPPRFPSAVRHNGPAEENIRRVIPSILATHDEAARSDETSFTYFSLIKPEDTLPNLSDATTKVIMQWEQSWNYHTWKHNLPQDQHPSPFAQLPSGVIDQTSLMEKSVQLVLETAAAILEMQPTYQPRGGAINREMIRFVGLYGPDYANDWLQGKIIRHHCQEKDLDADTWLKIIPRSHLKEIALKSHDHIGKIQDIMKQIEGPLSIEGIMKATGATKENVEALFSPSARYRIACSSNKDPIQKIYDILDRLGDTLSTEQLTHITGWSSQQVDAALPLWLRVRALTHSPLHPQEYLTRVALRFDESVTPPAIAEALGWRLPAVKELFPAATLRKIIIDHQSPLTEIQRIAHNYRRLSDSNLIPILQEHGLSEAELSIIFTNHVRQWLALRAGNPLDRARGQIKKVQAVHREVGGELYQAALAARTHSWSRARALAEHVQQEQANRPPGVSEKMWTWAIINFPEGDERYRLEFVKIRQAFFKDVHNLRDMAPLDRNLLGQEEITLYDNVDASRYTDPQEMLLPSDALDRLQEMAARAGLSPDDLEWLMDNATETSGIEGPFAVLIQRLRDAAG